MVLRELPVHESGEAVHTKRNNHPVNAASGEEPSGVPVRVHSELHGIALETALDDPDRVQQD